MPLKGIPFLKFASPLTSSPWTRHFRHLEQTPRHWLTRARVNRRSSLRVAPPKDRIKFWNIVPGDKVRLRGDGHSKIHEVFKVNKLANTVHFARTAKDESAGKVKYPQVPYARCQLFLGDRVLSNKFGEERPAVPVFALRLGKRNIFWSRSLGRWTWDRVALATVPRLRSIKEPLVVPWPQLAAKKTPEKGPYDTTKESLLEITYQPPPLPTNLKDTLPAPPSEHDYIRSLFHPGASPYDTSRPMEVAIERELANPHSRAKKQSRWQERTVRKKKLLEEFEQAELRRLNGRSKREAKAEAFWKWRELVAKEEKENRVRKKPKDKVARLERKRQRKARKLEKQRQRLKEMVLPTGKNQFVPEGAKVTSKLSASA